MTWTNIEEKMVKYESLQEEICKYFGMDYNEPMLVRTEIGWWSADEGSFYYGPDNFESDLDKGDVYGGDPSYIDRRSEFTYIRYDNGCGEEIHLVVYSNREITDPDKCERMSNA